jgi:hypothetical protein
LAGQSNAVGFGGDGNDLPDALQDSQESVLFWYDIGSGPRFAADKHLRPQEGTSTWVTLQPQVEWGSRVAFDKPQYGFTGQRITMGHGPEITLGDWLAKILGRKIAIIKVAWNGTPLAQLDDTLDWNPLSSQEYFDWMTTEVETALSHLETDLGQTGTVASLFWIQGGSDTTFAERAAMYHSNLELFADEVHAAWGSRLPIVIKQVPAAMVNFRHPDYRSPQPEHVAMVAEAQRMVGNANPYVTVVNTDDVPLAVDFAHFDSKGLQTMGHRLVNAYLAFGSDAIGAFDIHLPPDASYVVIDNDKDTAIDDLGDATNDRSSGSRASVGETDLEASDKVNRLILRFDLPNVPNAAGRMESAIFRLFLEDVVGTPTDSVSVFHSQTDNDVVPSPSDYEDATYADSHLDLVAQADPGQAYYEVDVTDLVLADYLQDGDHPMSAFRLQIDGAVFMDDDQDGRYRFTMPGAEANHPELVLIFIPEPSALLLAALGLLGLLAHARQRITA